MDKRKTKTGEGLGRDGRAVVRVRRERRDASQWRALIERQRTSGQSVRVFCLANDLGEASFYAWQARLREQLGHTSSISPSSASLASSHALSSPSNDFVRLQPAQAMPAPGDWIEAHFPGGAPGGVPGGVTLRCSSDHLPSLVRLLQSDDRRGA